MTHSAPADVRLDLDFTFVTDGLESAIKHARDAAGTKDVSVMGGGDIVRQCIDAVCWTSYGSTSRRSFSVRARRSSPARPDENCGIRPYALRNTPHTSRGASAENQVEVGGARLKRWRRALACLPAMAAR